MESNRRYDIVRKESEKAIYWLEGAAELSAAKSRVAELLSFWPGEYLIFDLESKQVVFTTSTMAGCPPPVTMPVSISAE
jgi:hypothetical protein